MKRINPLTYYKVGQFIEIEMQKPQIGAFPVGRADTGIVCKLQPNTRGFFEYSSRWSARITEVREKCLVVTPVEIVMTAAQNENTLAEKLAALHKPKVKKARSKVNYPFARKDEIAA